MSRQPSQAVWLPKPMSPESPTTTAHLTRTIIDYADTRTVIAKEAIYNTQGTKILDQGASIHAGLYNRLMAHQLSRPLEDALTVEGMVDGAAIRKGIEVAMGFEPFYARLAIRPQQVDRLLGILESIPLPEAVALQLTIARDKRPSLYDHALRSAWIMAWLSDDPLRPQFDIGMAAAAGLMHDLGMLHLNPVLMDHKIELTRELRRELYSHPIVSTLLVERHHVYPQEVVRAVMEHHEYLNGSGYPRGLRGRQISPMGQQLALTDLVVAMISGHDDGGELRLSVLLRMNMHRYARPLINRILGVLDPAQDPRSESVLPLAAPVDVLQQVHRVLQDWPPPFAHSPDITPARREGMAVVSELINELLRNLAEAGLTPAQLEQLGNPTEDPMLMKELSLLAREAVWQLRALARQARQRWAADQHSSHPGELQAWLDSADALSQRINGTSEGQEPVYTRATH